MQVLAVFTEQNHFAALESARKITVTGLLPADKANALSGIDATTWLNRIWDKAESALGLAVKRGLDAARDFVAAVDQLVDEAIGLGKAWVDDMLTVVRARIAEYMKAMVDRALSLVQSKIMVGGAPFAIDRVSIAQTVSLSTSVKLSLTEACEFVGEGQMEVSAEYAKA
jgi:hypothetical protein